MWLQGGFTSIYHHIITIIITSSSSHHHHIIITSSPPAGKDHIYHHISRKGSQPQYQLILMHLDKDRAFILYKLLGRWDWGWGRKRFSTCVKVDLQYTSRTLSLLPLFHDYLCYNKQRKYVPFRLSWMGTDYHIVHFGVRSHTESNLSCSRVASQIWFIFITSIDGFEFVGGISQLPSVHSVTLSIKSL